MTQHDDSKILNLVKKNDDKFFYSKGQQFKEINEGNLEKRWNSVVILIEDLEVDNSFKNETNQKWVLPWISSILFFLSISLLNLNIGIKIFSIFPALGMFLSIAAVKSLFGGQSKLINSFCNNNGANDCSEIINSGKWKIFKFINLSDLSIVFFASQLISMYVFMLNGDINNFLFLQKIILIASIPILLLSIYYQKYIERKWCTICLSIIGVTIFEFLYLQLLIENKSFFSFVIIAPYSFIIATTFFAWYKLKDIFVNMKEMQESRIVNFRFMRNYQIFKNTLISTKKIFLPDSPIILGNRNGKTEIAIVTSPFCGHCKNAHEILEKILINNRDKNLKIKIVFNADMESLDHEKRELFRVLLSIYFNDGETLFLEALSNWFKNKDIKNWLDLHKSTYDTEKLDSVYKIQNLWCLDNNVHLTPTIFINGYKYPKAFARENLEYFVYDILEDDF
ncbi:vitamin K epoxide reductase family protein [Flavobacterium qiangtangense]|uniref:Vitamin K epoxide reductase family protein n=1 Tax=Flavobacterium qiangtangense TaxID=1442595 RepID=A0ABW1PMN0_9FLAO